MDIPKLKQGGNVQNCKPVSNSSRWLFTTILLVVFLSSSVAWSQAGKTASKAAPGAGAPAQVGSWTSPAMLCPANGHCLVGANLALMHNGQVLFYYYPRPGSGPGSRSVVLDPVSGTVTDTLLTVSRDIFCSGIGIMPDGRVISTGGNAPNPPNNHSGTWNTETFDPATNLWTPQPNMNFARWYPSTIELADGRMLEVSGSNEIGTKLQNVMETYDYHTDTWTVLPATANLPNALLDGTAYPRLTLLTSGKVFASSPAAKTYVFDPVANTWTFQSGTNFGKRYYAGHVLLPGLQKVMIAGGSPVSMNGSGTVTNTAEIIDFSQKRPIWGYTSNPMNIARMNENLVLLPDGTVLMVGGGGGGGRYANPVLTPELYDPVAGTWTLMAPQIGTRTYHSTAAVLPDGRVLSAGADDKGIYQQTYEIYSPPYLFKGARPTITAAPTSLGYNAQFTITTPDAASITRVAVMRPTATTHADDMDQRYVDLTFTLGNGQITATSPLNANYAPPGWYMLVIVNSNGVPSVMPFLQIM